MKDYVSDITKSFHGLNEAGADRLCALIVIHLGIDRLLSLNLYRHIKRSGPPDDSEFNVIARLGFDARRKLARTAGLLTEKNAGYVKALNEARNQLLHVKVDGTFQDHPALATEMGFLTIYGPATHARGELIDNLTKEFPSLLTPDPEK